MALARFPTPSPVALPPSLPCPWTLRIRFPEAALSRVESYLRSRRLLQDASSRLNEATSAEAQATPAGYRHVLPPRGAPHSATQPASRPCARLGHPLGSPRGRPFGLSFAEAVFNEALRDIPLVPLPKSREERILRDLLGGCKQEKKKCFLFAIPPDQPAVPGCTAFPPNARPHGTTACDLICKQGLGGCDS